MAKLKRKGKGKERGKKPAPPPDPAHNPDDREEWVFSFPLSDGTTTRHDPLTVRAKLNEVLPDWRAKAKEFKDSSGDVPPGTPANIRQKHQKRLDGLCSALSEAVSSAFSLPAYDPTTGQGFTVLERMTVLAAYSLFSGDAVELSRPLPDGVEPGAEASPTPSADPSQPANASA